MAHNSSSRAENQDSGQNVVGYLHNVTPVKRSAKNNLYFNAYLQCHDTTRRVVSFDAEKQDMMCKAAKATSPVKLTNVSIVPSKSTDENDIQMNKRSRLEILTEPPFKKRKTETPGTSDTKKKVEDVVHPLEMLFQVADNTGDIKLNAWGDHVDALCINKSYKISRCSTRMYEDVYLTTTPQTDISSITEVEAIENAQTKSKALSNEGTISQVSITKAIKCFSCRALIQKSAIGKVFTTCTSCRMKMLSSKLTSSFTCKLNLLTDDNITLKLTCFSNMLTDFLNHHEKSLQTDEEVDDAENFLLLLPAIKIYHQNQIVMDMEVP
ncbi:uncharacterized protein [Argopecten irradians]|uniref:uncharacterized protein n=1 Tax=Argopecten irradians TaxID=31199 RepID=UPI00371804C3